MHGSDGEGSGEGVCGGADALPLYPVVPDTTPSFCFVGHLKKPFTVIYTKAFAREDARIGVW